jgi:exodeoxyribonuclease VII large subunit
MDSAPARSELTVSEVTRHVRELLEGAAELTRIWVRGEASNVRLAGSGHLYFTLKDSQAQLRIAYFRFGKKRKPPADGDALLVHGDVRVYEPRGEYQLIADDLIKAGLGDLAAQFEALKQKLDGEGLFSAERKVSPPRVPRRIGVVTGSATAALQDVLNVLRRRAPYLEVVLFPASVQGSGAPPELISALEAADACPGIEVILLVRGGGSLEDLWCFNDETLARALAQIERPVISGIGHEIDFTIADFVADQRAATPSAAAELASPDQQEWLQHIGHLATRLQGRIRDTLASNNQAVTWLAKHLQQLHPGQTLRQQAQRLDELERRSLASLQSTISRLQASLQTSQARLQQCSPGRRIGELQLHWRATAQRLGSAMQAAVTTRRQALAVYSRALNAISPLATLERGYAIVSRPGGDILRDASDVKTGEQINARLGRGKLVCTVDKSSGDT